MTIFRGRLFPWCTGCGGVLKLILFRFYRIRFGFNGELFPMAGDFDVGLAQLAPGGRRTESRGLRKFPAAPGTLPMRKMR